MTRPVLLYDQDCGVCRWSMLRVIRWSGGRLEAAPLQGERAAEALADLDAAARMASWHLLLPDGRRSSAGAAVPELMRYLPGLKRLAPLARTFATPIDALYRLVARNRHRLSRIVGEEACRIPGPHAAASDRPVRANVDVR